MALPRNSLSLGLPRMHKEQNEGRDFLPSFVRKAASWFDAIVLEENYGSFLGFQEKEYQSPKVTFSSWRQCFSQDIVLVLRYPDEAELSALKEGACLISMIHFPTRPGRVAFLKQKGIYAISLDCLTDDSGKRLVENLKAVGWNGLETAFKVLEQTYPDFHSRTDRPFNVTILGAGAVGAHAVQAAVHFGNTEFREKLNAEGIPGVLVTVLDREAAGHSATLEGVLKKTDILVDATSRRDPSKPVVANASLAHLPDHAVILDLSVDPYETAEGKPKSVKGIEGIPQGNLDKYIFTPDDPDFNMLPPEVDSRIRRTTVSCYSWPGIKPKECMELYGKQILPIIRTLAQAGGYIGIDTSSTFFHRALGRARLSQW